MIWMFLIPYTSTSISIDSYVLRWFLLTRKLPLFESNRRLPISGLCTSLGNA